MRMYGATLIAAPWLLGPPALAAPAAPDALVMRREEASALATFALGCIDVLQPPPSPIAGPQKRGSKALPGGVPASRDNPDGSTPYFWSVRYTVKPDYLQTRAFWGCQSWGSSVRASWALVRLLDAFKQRPAMAGLIREALVSHLGRSNIEGELTFFQQQRATLSVPAPLGSAHGFERPEGYAWLLKLDAALRASPDATLQRLAGNVSPLANWMREDLRQFLHDLPALHGPELLPTLVLLVDEADASGDAVLRSEVRRLVTKRAADAAPCKGLAKGSRGPIPTPCLDEAELMAKVLPADAFSAWLRTFLQDTSEGALDVAAATAEIGENASDALSRGRSLKVIAGRLPVDDPRRAGIARSADRHGARGIALLGALNDRGTAVIASAMLYLGV